MGIFPFEGEALSICAIRSTVCVFCYVILSKGNCFLTQSLFNVSLETFKSVWWDEVDSDICED